MNIKKALYLFVFLLVSQILSNVQCAEITPETLEIMFKSKLPKGIIYTKVPRGLIISVDGSIFFDGCKTKLKDSARLTLDIFSSLLKEIPNNCVIEDHTTTYNCNNSYENWEISAVRSSVIADYLMQKKDVPFDKIFYIGYGNIMPLKTNISSDALKLANRIDFVIIDYEAKR